MTIRFLSSNTKTWFETIPEENTKASLKIFFKYSDYVHIHTTTVQKCVLSLITCKHFQHLKSKYPKDDSDKEVEKHIIHKIIYMQAYYMHIHTHIVWNCVLTLITCLSFNKLLHVYSYIHGENVFLQTSQEIFNLWE